MTPYASAAHDWASAGWGAIPLPAGQKSPPPTGWTGRGTPYPSGADVQAWIEEDPSANLGLRFPEGTVGIDVDEYEAPDGSAKHGLATLIACTKQWGHLPPTHRITSRPDGRSGIYLYRLPAGVSSDHFLGELPSGNVEILRPEHRYAVGPGSTHPEGRPYLLLTRGNEVVEGVLRPEDLPELPAAWVAGLTVEQKMPAGADIELAGGRGDAYTTAAVERTVAELHDIAGWPTGKRDDRGRGWEKIQADAAYRLASLALAEWNTLTVAQAMQAFGGAAPTGGGWTGADIASKWRSQMRRAEPATPPKTSDDPFAPGYQPPPGLPVEEDLPEEMTVDAQTTQEWVKYSWDDRGNAERIVECFGHRLRYIESIDSWMTYDADAGKWIQSRRGGYHAAVRMIDELPRLEAHLYSTVKYKKGTKETSDRAEFVEWMAGQRADARYRAAANVLKGMGDVDDSMTSFDAIPRLLNCSNGIVDLSTGQLLPHDPVHRLSKQIGVAYDPTATAPLWQGYIDKAHPDVELKDYLQRVTGYSMTAEAIEQVFFIHQGPPNTGKSIYLDVVGALLDDLATVVPSNVLMAKKTDGHPTEIMGLAGRRFLTMSESAEGARLDAALVKRLSGNDVLSARGMGQDFRKFKLVGKIHLATNHLPHIPDDKGLQRRIHVVQWNEVIPDGKVDRRLSEKIISRELPGVLAWAVRGAIAWYRESLSRPLKYEMAALDYFAEEDEFGMFIAEKLAPSEVTYTTSKVLYQHYLRWSDSNRIRPMSHIAFGRKLSARGIKQYRTPTERGYQVVLKGDPIVHDPFAS